jgi:hypothetical protein
MIEINTKGGLGDIMVDTQQFQGHPPEYWAKRCTEKICSISENAPTHIRQQAQEYQLAIYKTILYYIEQSLSSQRCTMGNILAKQGHDDLAKILKELT